MVRTLTTNCIIDRRWEFKVHIRKVSKKTERTLSAPIVLSSTIHGVRCLALR